MVVLYSPTSSTIYRYIPCPVPIFDNALRRWPPRSRFPLLSPVRNSTSLILPSSHDIRPQSKCVTSFMARWTLCPGTPWVVSTRRMQVRYPSLMGLLHFSYLYDPSSVSFIISISFRPQLTSGMQVTRIQLSLRRLAIRLGTFILFHNI